MVIYKEAIRERERERKRVCVCCFHCGVVSSCRFPFPFFVSEPEDDGEGVEEFGFCRFEVAAAVEDLVCRLFPGVVEADGAVAVVGAADVDGVVVVCGGEVCCLLCRADRVA